MIDEMNVLEVFQRIERRAWRERIARAGLRDYFKREIRRGERDTTAASESTFSVNWNAVSGDYTERMRNG